MPDVFSDITKASPNVLEHIVKALEMRAANSQLQAMLDAYLSEIILPDSAEILEVGSGTGSVARCLACFEQAERVVGVDPSPVYPAKARELAQGIDNLSFEEGDGRSLPFEESSFDLVVLHTLLCHVPKPEIVIRRSPSGIETGRNPCGLRPRLLHRLPQHGRIRSVALKAEAERRVEQGQWYGRLTFASVIARKAA